MCHTSLLVNSARQSSEPLLRLDTPSSLVDEEFYLSSHVILMRVSLQDAPATFFKAKSNERNPAIMIT
jgi:hypothetical protein